MGSSFKGSSPLAISLLPHLFSSLWPAVLASLTGLKEDCSTDSYQAPASHTLLLALQSIWLCSDGQRANISSEDASSGHTYQILPNSLVQSNVTAKGDQMWPNNYLPKCLHHQVLKLSFFTINSTVAESNCSLPLCFQTILSLWNISSFKEKPMGCCIQNRSLCQCSIYSETQNLKKKKKQKKTLTALL